MITFLIKSLFFITFMALWLCALIIGLFTGMFLPILGAGFGILLVYLGIKLIF